MDLPEGRFLLNLFYVVPFLMLSASSEIIHKSPFVCFKDICNRDTTVQYCDLQNELCKSCDDVRDDCFTGQMQENCTDFCHDFKAKKKMEELRGQDCPALSGIVHGNYNVTGPVQHGDIVGVNCHSGYRISGSSSLKCSDFGSWNGVQASCKAITCRSIVAPGQGSSNTSGSTIFHIGDTIEFHCNVYYRLVGESVITCSENGEWNNRVPFCQAITCRSIKEPDQGTSNVTGSNIFQIRDAVKFQCSVNYTLVGESVITCTENGEWSNREPFCQEITCGKLLPTLYWSWVYSETGPSRPGTIAKIKCHKSHDNIDGHDLICSQNGTWVSDIDQKTYMPFCAEEGDSNKVVPLWLFIVGCIGSFLLPLVVGLSIKIPKMRRRRKFLNRSSNSVHKGTQDEQRLLMNAENQRTTCHTTNEQNEFNSKQCIPMVQFINYNQPNNSQTNNQAINKSRPDNRGNDSSDNNSQGGTSGDRGQTLTPEDHFPTQVVDDQKNDKIQPHDQQTTNSQADNGSARFASTPIGSDIAQPHSSVAQLSPGSTLTANLRGGVHSQPASDNDDQRAAKILPSGGTQPIHGDDI
ncbi:uncharacterized protein LOC128209059 isoform X2 [Mya arenaria]|uniref:uncharacterized protein LOC128209059 isoform X2 n=1 Tax=Mya arenaria TaxID=6604 RepID=UPI0022E4E11C|nr:uncharacterized protein LOC128209059 isoform X2 [Mya arenaria]